MERCLIEYWCLSIIGSKRDRLVRLDLLAEMGWMAKYSPGTELLLLVPSMTKDIGGKTHDNKESEVFLTKVSHKVSA